MAEGEIVNKVAQSPLITFNLEDYLPAKVEQLDIAQFLDGGYLLREIEFRAALKDFDYSPFVGAAVRIHCSTDAILPAWASILVASKLSDRDIRSFWAPTEEAFFAQYYRWKLAQVHWSSFEGRIGPSKRSLCQFSYVVKSTAVRLSRLPNRSSPATFDHPGCT
jgi:hypothetical protein